VVCTAGDISYLPLHAVQNNDIRSTILDNMVILFDNKFLNLQFAMNA